MDYDYKLLEDQDFFKENGNELLHFKDIKEDLNKRIKKLKISLKIFHSFIWVLNIALVIFGVTIFDEEVSMSQILIWVLGLLIVFSGVTQFYMFKEEKIDERK